MYTVCVGTLKGGCGKSTIACNLAAIAASKGKRVLLVDADDQGSAIAWRGDRASDDIKAMALNTPTLHKDLPGFADAFDLCIIDAGKSGRESAVLRSAMMACDLLIMPCLPSQFDIYVLADTLAILKDGRVYKDIPARLVLNQLLQRAKVSAEAQEALREIAGENDTPLLNATLFNRVAFKNAIGEGQGVTEYEPGGKAAEEMLALYDEIFSQEGLTHQ